MTKHNNSKRAIAGQDFQVQPEIVVVIDYLHTGLMKSRNSDAVRKQLEAYKPCLVYAEQGERKIVRSPGVAGLYAYLIARDQRIFRPGHRYAWYLPIIRQKDASGQAVEFTYINDLVNPLETIITPSDASDL